MADDLMGRLAAGLRGAGSVLSPQVFRGMEAERLQQGNFEGQMQRDRQIQQFRQQQQQEQDQAISRVVGPYIQKGDFAGAAKAAAATPGMFDVGMKLWGQVEARAERAESAAARLEESKSRQAQNYSLSLQRLEDQRQAALDRASNAAQRMAIDSEFKAQGLQLRAQNDAINQRLKQADIELKQQGLASRLDREKEKKELRKSGADIALSNSESNFDRLAFEAKAIRDHPALGGITGLWGAVPDRPGSDAANVRAKLNVLKSQVAFSTLQAMRDASKTGGALGQVSERELTLLQSNLAALETSQSTAEYKKSLDQIIKYTEGAKKRLRDAHNATYAAGEPVSTGSKVVDFGSLK